ncbi:MAG: glycosyltransferase family 4 protein [Deltaproteobacteria bacterium]|nr:glycosyltransferase family 4 protein [Deltaproteobacteria bacterium]
MNAAAEPTPVDVTGEGDRRPAPDGPMRVCSPQMSLSKENTHGGGVFHLKLLEALADAGTPCLIPLAFRWDYEPRDNWDVRVIPIQRTYKLGPLISNAVFFSSLWFDWFAMGERYRVLRVTDPYYVGPAAWLFSKLTGVTTIAYVFHIEDSERVRNRVLSFVCRRCDGVVVTSRFSRAQVAASLGLSEEKIDVTYGGVTHFSAKTMAKSTAKRRIGLPGKTVLGFIGALSERKNPGYALEVFAELHRRNPNRHLMMVGPDPEPDGRMIARLRKRARQLGIEDAVTFTGRVESARKAVILQAMDLFLFPSLLEGFGLAVVEAMALGVPAVVSDRGSLPEVVDHGENGLVLPLEDREKFTDEVDALLHDQTRLMRYGKRAREVVDERFTWQTCAVQTGELHERIDTARRFAHIGVVLNSGDGVATMTREGQLARFEKFYVGEWAKQFREVSIFSYGDDRGRPAENASYVPGRPGLAGLLYAAIMPLVHRRRFRRLSLIRVMQAGAAIPALIAKALWRTPMVVTYGYRYDESMQRKGRPLYAKLAGAIARRAVRRADRVIVTTPSLRDEVAALTDEAKIELVPNGVDLSAFRQKSHAKPGADARLELIFVGRLTPQKNLALLADALEPHKDRVRLTLVGDGQERSRLEAAYRQAGIDARFLGTIAHENLPSLLQAADAFVLPSRIEGHPKALIEAMASGLACVGADVEGIRDVIRPNETGLLVAGDPTSFAEAIGHLLDDPALVERLGTAAREQAEAMYDLRRTLAREREILRSVVAGS